MRLAVLTSHPIQYQAPLFREIARRLDVEVFFAHKATMADQADAGFGVGFDWDVDLLSGYEHGFLRNVARHPSLDHFSGCDTPTIAERLVHGRFDAFLVMGWHLKSFWQGIWAAKRGGVPVMVRGDSHLATPRSGLKRVGKSFVYPVALRVFDAALYVGERSRQYWEHYNYPRHRLFFSPHCVDNAWFSERATDEARTELRARHGIAADANVALFAGKLLPIKRPLDLVEAAGMLLGRKHAPVILVAGSGPLAEAVSATATDLGLRIVQLGFCNQTQMPAAYAAADLLVLPSGRETWGLVANESLSSGRPIVVSDACGCAPDLVADGSAGRSYPMGDVALLSEAIARVLAEPPTPMALAAKASRYSVAAAADGVCHALDYVAGKQRAAV